MFLIWKLFHKTDKRSFHVENGLRNERSSKNVNTTKDSNEREPQWISCGFVVQFFERYFSILSRSQFSTFAQHSLSVFFHLFHESAFGFLPALYSIQSNTKYMATWWAFIFISSSCSTFVLGARHIHDLSSLSCSTNIFMKFYANRDLMLPAILL